MRRIPFFSVVIPLYNKSKHINRSIDSVFHQSERDFEIIVVNDGSSDGGEKLVKQYNDPRIILYDQENTGVSVARNRGVELSRGEYITFLDADDEWIPNFLAEIRNLIKLFPEARMYSTAYTIILNDESNLNPSYKPLPEHPWKGIIPNYIECKIYDSDPVTSSTVCIKREVFKSLDGFIPGMKIGEDTEMWSRIFFKYPCAFSSKRCATYYKNGTNRSTVIKSYLKDYYKFIKIMQDNIENNIVPVQYISDVQKYISNQLLHMADLMLIHGEKKEAFKILMDPRIKSNTKKKIHLLVISVSPNFVMPVIKKLYNFFIRATTL